MRDRIAQLGALAALLLAPAAADACRCVARPPAALARAADAIVIADVGSHDDRDPVARTYRVTALRSWKARLAGLVAVRSEQTTCRAELASGGRYLIYLKRGPDGGWWTDACSGNLPAARAGAVTAKLGRPAGGP